MATPRVNPFTTITGLTITPNYSTGDALGTLTTVAMPYESGVIDSLLAIDLSAATGINFDVFILRDNQLNGTAVTDQTDNGAFDLADADAPLLVGIIQMNSYFASNDSVFGVEANINLPYEAHDGNLYVFCVSRGAHNLVAATDIRIAFGVTRGD